MKGEQCVELRTAPDCIRPVIRNIEAILSFIQPVYRNHALFMMEQIHHDYPENINTIANLIEMKRNLKMDTKTLDQKLKKMQSEGGNKLEQARCLLEIGYVLLTDLHSEVPKSAGETLSNIHKQLEVQMSFITESRQAATYKQALENWTEATHRIQRLLPQSCLDGTKREQSEAITYFEDGLAMMKAGTEAGIWKHYLARAHSRVGTADRNISKTTEKKKHMLLALRNFMACITETATDTDYLKVYVARSYAYVGHLIATRHKEIKGKEDPVPCFIMQSQEFQRLWEYPMEAFTRAHKICDTDRVVHTRHGLTLKDKRSLKQNADYEQHIYQAIGCFKRSLKIEQIYNWFAYSQLCQAYLELYKHQRKLFQDAKDHRNQREPDKKSLDEAIHNGQLALQQRASSKTMLHVTESFYLKAIKPKTEKGLEIVEDVSSISAAQDVIQRALAYHDCNEHEYLRMYLGKCLFHKGDKKAGIEEMLDVQMKNRNAKTEPNQFRELLIIMINEFRTWKDDKRNEIKSRQRRQKLRKIWVVLTSGKVTYGKRLRHPIIGILNWYPHEFVFLLREVYSFKNSRRVDRELAAECLDALKKHHGADVKRRVQELDRVQPDKTDVLDTQEQGEPSKYSCCICTCKEDEIWRKTFIEERGLVQTGKICSKGDHLEFGKETKYMFIISEAFNNDENCMAMVSTIKNRYPTSNRLIPILTDHASIPVHLGDVHALDFVGLRNNNVAALTAALLQPINDSNVPRMAANQMDQQMEGIGSGQETIYLRGNTDQNDGTIPSQMADVPEGIADSDNDVEGMEIDEPAAAKRMKTDDAADAQDSDGQLTWAEQVDAISYERKDTEPQADNSGDTLQDKTEMDSGFDSEIS